MLAVAACRSTNSSDRELQLPSGWRYLRSEDWQYVEGASCMQSALHYELKLQGQSCASSVREGDPRTPTGDASTWQAFLVVVGPFGRTEPPVAPPVLSFRGASPDVTGRGVATFDEPRFDFALPLDLLQACTATGASWILHDGETRLPVTLSAQSIREFLEALDWAAQVGELEELAAPALYKVLPEPQ